MATCPNKSLQDWKDLVDSRGEDIAYYLWDKHEGNVPRAEYSAQLKGVLEQIEDVHMSTASEALISKVKEAAQKMGISIQRLSDYAKETGLRISGVNGVADLVRGIIALADGQTNVALTEEMVHIATAILEQTNPQLVTEMISKIDKFKIYQKTLDAYKGNKNYQLPDGKPDIRKIKKEAVDKLIAELIVRDSDGNTEYPELLEEVNRSTVRTWWTKILDFIKSLYKKSNISIYEEAAAKVIKGDVEARYYSEAKEGTDTLFEEHPELSTIGTPEQYSAYLDNIFPNSKVKVIVYHGTEQSFEEFNKEIVSHGRTKGEGIYFTDNKKSAERFAGISELDREMLTAEEISKYVKPAIVNSNKSIEDNEVVVQPEQIHLLGSKQDIEGFREFIKNAPIEVRGEGVFYQLSDQQKAFQEKKKATANTLFKEESKEPADPMFMDTEEANNWYEVIGMDGVRRVVKNRVTDRVKAWYKKRFPGKTFSAEEKAFNEFKRTTGVKGHKWLEEIHDRYFDNEEGTRRTTPKKRPSIGNKTDEEVYSKLEHYYVELINKFSENGKTPLVYSEVKLYDPKADEAGTVDLLIVEQDGTAHIIDWKFMNLGASEKDVQWYKQGAYNIQLGRYKEMLEKNYGIKKFGWNRAIPILMKLGRKDIKDKNSETVLRGISIGSVDPSKIEDLRLVPVSEETESTGFAALDQLIERLNAVYKQIVKVETGTEAEREYKRERMNALRSAIRAAQGSFNISPLVEVIDIMKREGEQILDDYNTSYKDRPVSIKDFKDSDLSDFAENMREYMSVAEVFGDVDLLIGDLVYHPSMEKTAKTKDEKAELAMRKNLRAEIDMQARTIKKSQREIEQVSKDFADKFIGQRNLVVGLLKPEAVVQGLSSLFRGVSELPLASLQILFKIVTNAKARAAQNALEEVNELLEIRKKLEARGGDLRKLVQQIYQRDDKNKLVNKLIRRFDKKFYDLVDANAQEDKRDKQWLLDNIDVASYREEADAILEDKIERIHKMYGTKGEKVTNMILQEQQKWDIDRKDFNGWNNYVIKRHPINKWETEEYIKLKQDPELFELYNFIQRMNEKAKDVGYISNKLHSTFLPFVRKSMAESLTWDFDLTAIKNMGNALSMNADDVGYGAINELTKELEHSIPKYYVNDFSKKENGERDYSDVSEDLFKNLILYVSHMEKYTSLSEVEGQLLLVKNVETFKKHLNTSRSGEVIPGESPLAGNEKNAKIFDDFLRALLYEQKYPLSEADTPLGLGKVLNFMKSAVNTVAGREVWKKDENPSATSLMKTMDMANRGFQLKTLGLEFISGAVNAFGGNIQVATQAGGYFKAREFAANELKLIGNRFINNEEREMFIQLMDTFMPLKDDPLYDRLKEAGMSKLTQHNFSDWLMVFMREPEQHIEKSIFLTLLQNTMVVNGKIVSIREYVKKQYPNRFASGAEYKEINRKIEAEIEELKKTQSIDATKKLVDGKLEIPGLDMTDRTEMQRLTNLTRRLSRNATGGLSDSDLNRMGMSIWTKSMMVFKNWIPKLVDTRFSEFRQISDDFSVTINEDGMTEGEKYDVGRVRLFANILGDGILRGVANINNIIQLNDKGLERLDKLYKDYAEKYEKRTGKELNMTKEDFIDLIRTNLRNEVKELTILLSLLGAMMSMGFFQPDDDANKAQKNFYRYSQRVVDKFIGELSFFYNPIEFQKLLSGSMFPAIGIFSDIERFITHFTMQITGYDISNRELTEEQVKKKAQPIKYLSKMFPGTKSAITYMSIFDSDFAKEFDVTIQKETRR